MVDLASSGDAWSEQELDLIVQTYFLILEGAPNAPRGFKADAKRALNEKIRRGIGSIDFKLGNLSYIATQVGLPELPGFAPAPKAQKGPIYKAFERYIAGHPEVLADEAFLPSNIRTASMWEKSVGQPISDRGAGLAGAILPTDPIPHLSEAAQARPAGLARLVRKLDPAARDHRNRVLGRIGEQYVLEHEIARLIAADRGDLANRVEWTSDARGDGAGYDIHSFDLDGSDRLIEVKSTKGGPTTDFFLTRTEKEVSLERPDHWRLYRLHTVTSAPRLFVLKPPLERSVRLEAESWRAKFS